MRPIVLIQPREGIYSRLHTRVPLSLLAIASRLFREGHRIHIIDQRIDQNWGKRLRNLLQDDPLCVGITSMTGSQILSALDASRIVKEHGKCPVIWGGVHPTLFPSQTLENPYIDMVVRGEGELTFYELVKALEGGGDLKGIPGLSFKTDRTIWENPDRPFQRIDDLPEMAYGMVTLSPYLHPSHGPHQPLSLL